jgi:hypothetical protein
MAIDPDILSSLASDYAKGMTTIRGRRVQRLLKREFSGAEHVLLVTLGSGARGVLGVSATGAAFCATDGRGRHAAVSKWLHGSTQAVEFRFDLLKDSLPEVDANPLPIANLRCQVQARIAAQSVPDAARPLVGMALEVLA